MMKKIFCLLVLAGVFACQKKEEATRIATANKEAITVDSGKKGIPKAGADEDLHGCITSAGYTWSVLKGECVRVFEAGTRLTPYDDSTGVQMAAFVIFKEDKAELFIQTEKPMVLVRKTEGEPFVNGPWQLIPWKGYILKKDGKILYTGQ